MLRGAAEIEAASSEARRAATRNAHKGDYHREPLCKLFDKLDEERDEFYEALLSGTRARIREELGDLVWTATMIADHGGQLLPSELPSAGVGEEVRGVRAGA